MLLEKFIVSLLIVGFGVLSGVGAYTFIYARGYSYLSNDPSACANCHIMHEQFDGWIKGSHRNVATCNDCHTPHDFFGKYMTKALNGYNHSMMFTLGGYPDPIQITERNRRITEGACRSCHEAIVDAIDSHGRHAGVDERLSCITCHRSVGHLEQ